MTKQYESIWNIVNSSSYRTVMVNVCKRLGLDFVDEIPEVVLSRDVHEMEAAGLSEAAALKLIADRSDEIQSFAVLKYSELENEENDGEFPPNEPQEPGGRGVVIEVHPMFSDFLIPYIIEYWLVTTHPDRLSAYLKAMKIPFAKRYAAQLVAWVNG